MTTILLVNKPKGLTSREVCNRIKSVFKCKKVGHSGTLDSNATGLLLVALDNAVKAMPLFENLDKEYEGKMYLHKDVETKELTKAISQFVGEIVQVPPVRSRVARKPRKRIVYDFKIIEKNDKEVKFRTKVQAGTYIRKLVSDIGEKIGGAHLRELKRIKVGNFSIKNAYTLEEIEKNKEKHLIEIEKAIDHVKRVYVKNFLLKKLLNGSPIFFNWLEKYDKDIKKGEKVAIMVDDKLVAIGVAKVDADKFESKRSIIKTDRIIVC